MSTVLIAEDNPVNRELLRELLETRGYSVSEACNLSVRFKPKIPSP